MAKKSRFDHIFTEKQGSVLWLTLNRPGRMNTFNLEMIDEVSTAVEEADIDEEVRCILVKGEGDKAFTINHKGAVNVTAVMEWAKEKVPDPEVIFITGCSAGAYGSIFWAPHILEQYPNAKVYQMGDSGCGVITQSFLENSFPVWNGTAILPTWIDALHPDTLDVPNAKLQDIYTHVADHYSTQLFSQYTTVNDENQVFYFKAMGGTNVEEWSEQMLSSLAAIAEKSPNFRRFIAPGDRHCILPHEAVWTLEVEGVKFIDWLLNMVSGIPIDEVICAECGGQE